jgi:23S rRNA (adenine2503-C2)-methyltransferase
MGACARYARVRRRKVLFEWTLIAGRTDSAEQARAVGALLRTLPSQLNVIPLNPTEGYDGAASTAAAVDRWRAEVEALGVPTSVRQRRAVEVAGGCGQLAAATRR